jgi:UPF0716 protein FxsA
MVSRWIPAAVLATVLVEVAVFTAVVYAVGAGWAVLAALLTSTVGLILLRREGTRAWRRFRTVAEQGQPPGEQVSDGVVGLVGALLLAVPGFVTALVGLLLIVPPLRSVGRRRVQALTEQRLTTAAAGDLFGPRRVRVHRGDPVPEPRPATGDVPLVSDPGPAIEGEIVR